MEFILNIYYIMRKSRVYQYEKEFRDELLWQEDFHCLNRMLIF